MATPTYELIETTTLTSSASSVSFSSITQDYRDLVLVIDGDASADPGQVYIKINNDSGSNYNVVRMFGTGSSAGSSSQSSVSFGIDTGLFFSSGQANGIIQFLDYSATDKHKSLLTRTNTPSQTRATAGRWANTAAITQIEITTTSTPTYAAGTIFSLYGIA